MQNINKTVAKATKWSMATEIIAKLISPIVNMILARLLLPEAFGAVATITMIISFAEIFTDAGFQKYIVQHEFADEKDYDESVNVAFWSNFTISALIVFFIWIFRDALAIAIGASELANGISVSSLSILIVAFSSIQMAVYRRNFEYKALFYIRMIITMIPLVVTVPLAVYFRNYWALIIGTLCRDFVQAVVLTYKSKWKPRFYYSITKLKEMFSFTSWTLLETIMIWLTSYIGTFIVGRSLNEYYLGLYKTSITTVNSYMALITGGTTSVMFSTLSRCQDDDNLFKTTYFQFQRMVAILLIPLSIGIYCYRDFIVDILLGPQWKEASDFLGMWGMTSAVSIILGSYASEVYRSKGKPIISLLTQGIHLCFLVPTLLISANYGFDTLCVSRTAVRIQYITTAMIVLQVCFKIKIIDTVKNILPQAISALIMGFIAVLIKDIFAGMLWQIVTISVCVVVYFGVLMLFPSMRKTIFEIDFIKKLRRKYDTRF